MRENEQSQKPIIEDLLFSIVAKNNKCIAFSDLCVLMKEYGNFEKQDVRVCVAELENLKRIEVSVNFDVKINTE